MGTMSLFRAIKTEIDKYDTDSATIRLILTKVNSRDEGR